MLQWVASLSRAGRAGPDHVIYEQHVNPMARLCSSPLLLDHMVATVVHYINARCCCCVE